jgi:hypothetical protein
VITTTKSLLAPKQVGMEMKHTITIKRARKKRGYNKALFLKEYTNQ